MPKKSKTKTRKAKAVKKVVKFKSRAKKKPVKGSKKPKADKKSGTKEDILQELIERGKPKGFVTSWEMMDYLPRLEKDLPYLEEVYDRLEQ